MNFEKFAPFVVAIAILVAGTGQTPRVINAVRHAQFLLIQTTKASTLPKVPMIKRFKRPF